MVAKRGLGANEIRQDRQVAFVVGLAKINESCKSILISRTERSVDGDYRLLDSPRLGGFACSLFLQHSLPVLLPGGRQPEQGGQQH